MEIGCCGVPFFRWKKFCNLELYHPTFWNNDELLAVKGWVNLTCNAVWILLAKKREFFWCIWCFDFLFPIWRSLLHWYLYIFFKLVENKWDTYHIQLTVEHFFFIFVDLGYCWTRKISKSWCCFLSWCWLLCSCIRCECNEIIWESQQLAGRVSDSGSAR